MEYSLYTSQLQVIEPLQRVCTVWFLFISHCQTCRPFHLLQETAPMLCHLQVVLEVLLVILKT